MQYQFVLYGIGRLKSNLITKNKNSGFSFAKIWKAVRIRRSSILIFSLNFLFLKAFIWSLTLMVIHNREQNQNIYNLLVRRF